MVRSVFTLIGIIFIVSFFFTDPSAKTDDGYSLRYFFLFMGIWFAGLPFFISGIARYRKKRKTQRKAYFTRQGIQATATVESAEATGVLINHFPQYRFHLKLRTDDGKEWTTSENKVIDFMDMSRLQPGAFLPVFVDPEDYTKVFVCWDEARYPARTQGSFS